MKQFTRWMMPALLLPTLIASSLHAAGGTDPRVRLLESTSSSWTYRYTPSPFMTRTIDIDGKAHRVYDGPATAENAGLPLLPVEVLTLGVPENTGVTVELTNASYTEESGVLVAPAPHYTRTEEGEALPSFEKDPSAYARDAWFPDVLYTIEGPYTVRQARLVSIRLSPLQYDPRTGTLRRLSTGTLVIRRKPLSGPALARMPVAPPDPMFEQEYRGLMENADEATAWRYRSPAAPQADTSGGWFTPGAAFIRIPVANDGWYRITAAELASLGLTPPSLDTSTVKLLFRGQQVPLLIDPDMSLSFYGMRKRGDSTYLDYYTDTSSYWLSWQQPGAAKRYLPAASPVLSPPDTQIASRVNVHFESNTDYYEGTGDAEVTLNGQAPGEGWTWEYFYPNTVKYHDIMLDRVWRNGDTTVTIRARLYSTTRNYNTPDHIARFWINDSLVGEISFNGRKEGLFEKTFPVRWLKEGSNRVKILSVPTLSSPNQFYLDWFEIDYMREHVASGGMLTCAIEPAAGKTDRRIRVRGLPQPAVRVLDLTGGRRINAVDVQAEAGGTWAAVFDDTVTVPRRFLVVTDAAALSVQGMARKTFVGLRSHLTGADYIIITHALFRAAADRLAAHRASHNGVRAVVVDVQDIYDEFNYGHLSSESVKAFVRMAYDTWPGPAPAHLLMFGDASWDYHRYMTSTIMTNYVPAYGVPAGDNWYVCFDQAFPFVPFLNVGRLPVQNPVQAEHLVDKLTGYDSYAVNDWNKNFLFISGGTTPSEKLLFNGQCDALVNDVVLPAPIGGTPFKVYKATANTIDGENKQLLRSLVRDGLVYMNFLGHSGGRVWGVDIGSPADLENTNGMLPFVTSVSCNVGAFAEPSSNVLSEDFVLADNRGAVAMWASSSLGYANIGASLVRYFLEHVRDDTARVLGSATTASRIQLWQSRGADYITVASMNLNPLLGDPLSMLAVPKKPDLAITPADLSLDIASPTPLDTTAHVRMIAHNYGLVPGDSVRYALTDFSSHGVDSLVVDGRIRPTLHRDTLFIPWRGTATTGSHQLSVALDARGLLDELTKANNSASIPVYVYAHTIRIVKPMVHEVVPPGTVALVVTAPVGGDTSLSAFEFELDTVATFSSGVRVVSGALQPGPVGSRWVTPSLAGPRTYFWRARTIRDTIMGRWATSSFIVDNGIAPGTPILLREATASQFATGVLSGTSATDSGLTLRPSSPLSIGARSLGYRAASDKEYYSIIRIAEQTIFGYWWEHGNSFMVVRLNAFTGAYEFKPFNVSGNGALADSMSAFLNTTPVGDYVLISVIYDGYSNVNAGLKASIKALGSVKIDSVRPGHSWMLIARKSTAPPYFVLEQWSANGVAEDSTVIPNTYAIGSGYVTSVRNPFPSDFGTLHWSTSATSGVHSLRGALLGFMAGGRADTLVRIESSETVKDLSPIAARFRDSAYVSMALAGALSTGDALTTPVIREWSVSVSPPADLAISTKSLGGRTRTLAKRAMVDLPMTIYNLGYRTADSARIRVDLVHPNGAKSPVAYGVVDAIPVDGEKTVTVTVPPGELTGFNILEVTVMPPAGARDLLSENNTGSITINFTSVNDPLVASMRFFADGVPLMDGDYVSRTPEVLVQLAEVSGIRQGQERMNLYIDNALVAPGVQSMAQNAVQSAITGDGALFMPQLADGAHELTVRLYRWNGGSGTDSVEQRISVNVVSETRILRVYNYPNPFTTSTEFTFVLTGARAPDEVSIRIFTIAGRRIHEIIVPHGHLQVGFNRVPWDGRDADGDELANGYYLYQIRTKGEGSGASVIEKLVKAR